MICEPEEALEQIYPLKPTQFVYFPGRNFPVRKMKVISNTIQSWRICKKDKNFQHLNIFWKNNSFHYIAFLALWKLIGKSSEIGINYFLSNKKIFVAWKKKLSRDTSVALSTDEDVAAMLEFREMSNLTPCPRLVLFKIVPYLFQVALFIRLSL